MDASQFQKALHDLAFDLGARSHRLFSESFTDDWPDEESTTGALFGALVNSAMAVSRTGLAKSRHGIELRAQLTKKRDEAEHGADVFIKFSCDEPQWQIKTTTVIQAKKLEPTRSMTSGDHARLTKQLNKMLAHTTESFLLIYSSTNGIQVVPAVAVRSLGTRKPFDLDMMSWQWFLSAIFRGRLGEPNSDRLPGKPKIEVTLVAKAASEESMAGGMVAG
ncbi:hypothetical protein NKH61_29435 [Mesorhizobium sp. M1005]|uniref:hypothetical protein n=1 Tax=unclassified Mesorhizobium TaxID=325217 RepID=UPI00333CE4A8